ncbi:hypothetical protein BHE74_00036936 [Ensete ventricosum]|nr:hypothetical protein BHE74_00036936 [Ensete ventricosum]RZR83773.1 hypothetical protein BHM03_00010477 [Ensete ventricosum]
MCHSSVVIIRKREGGSPPLSLSLRPSSVPKISYRLLNSLVVLGIWRFGGGTLAPDLGWFASRRGRVGTLTLGCAVGDLQKAVTFAKEEVLFISTVKFCGMHLVA